MSLRRVAEGMMVVDEIERGKQMSHFIEVCKFCESVISQCRCPSKDKEIRYGVCNTCKEKGLDIETPTKTDQG